MSQEDEFKRFLPDESVDPDHLSIGIPAERPLVHPDRIPSGFDPMGEIQLRGQASRGLASGRIPWWILITGWVLFGSFALIALLIALQSSSIFAWIMLAIALIIPFLLLYRGTTAKLAASRRRRR